MKNFLLPVIFLAAPLSVQADDALLKKHNCVACHQVQAKVVGPSYKMVADKYRGQIMTDKLAAKIRAGGTGVWGQIPMPPNPQVTEADAKALAKYILEIK